jgi:hypothetical protein
MCLYCRRHLLQAASYEFTTLTCVPGIVRYRGAKIQMLDLPGGWASLLLHLAGLLSLYSRIAVVERGAKNRVLGL